MREIENIDAQLKDIIFHMNIPVLGGGSKSDYLACIGCGMIQFVCIRKKRECYQSLTADNIFIHPGSVMFKQDPLYIVAGEIVRTSRMYAMSVSPLTKSILAQISPDILRQLENIRKKKTLENQADEYEQHISKKQSERENKKAEAKDKNENTVTFGGEVFPVKIKKGKKQAMLAFDEFTKAARAEENSEKIKSFGSLMCKIVFSNGFVLLENEKLTTAIKLAKNLDLFRHSATTISQGYLEKKIIFSHRNILVNFTSIRKKPGRL